MLCVHVKKKYAPVYRSMTMQCGMDTDGYFLVFLQFDSPSAYKDKVVASGLPASPGAAVGQVVFCAEDAEVWHAEGKHVILVLDLPCCLCIQIHM